MAVAIVVLHHLDPIQLQVKGSIVVVGQGYANGHHFAQGHQALVVLNIALVSEIELGERYLESSGMGNNSFIWGVRGK